MSQSISSLKSYGKRESPLLAYTLARSSCNREVPSSNPGSAGPRFKMLVYFGDVGWL